MHGGFGQYGGRARYTPMCTFGGQGNRGRRGVCMAQGARWAEGGTSKLSGCTADDELVGRFVGELSTPFESTEPLTQRTMRKRQLRLHSKGVHACAHGFGVVPSPSCGTEFRRKGDNPARAQLQPTHT